MENTDPTVNKTLLIIFLLFVLIVGAFVGYYFYHQSQSVGPTSQGGYSGLLAHNEDFATAERLRLAGDGQSAIPYYQQALAQTTDVNEQGQIKYLIAASQDRTSTVGEAVQQLKDIAANSAYTPIQQAYAVQKIGEFFYRNTNNTNIADIVFSGQPYADFYREGDILLALRRLYEYATSFYPVAVSELRAAHWYGIDLIRLKQKGNLTAAEQETWNTEVHFIQDALVKADADIQRTLHNPNTSKLIPDALTRKASVLGYLKIAEVPAADPEAAFKSAIEAGIANKNEVSPRYSYAVYLTRAYGAGRAADIQKNLSVIYADIGAPLNIGFKILFENEKRNVTGGKAIMVEMASIDPNFKKALLALGWTTADFK